jgi:hypothetical protein
MSVRRGLISAPRTQDGVGYQFPETVANDRIKHVGYFAAFKHIQKLWGGRFVDGISRKVAIGIVSDAAHRALSAMPLVGANARRYVRFLT